MKNVKALNTQIEYITNTDTDAAFLENAAIILRKGGLVAFPTETVYGIGANALDENAVKKIFVAKGRPSDNPLIVHIANKSDVYDIAIDIPDTAEKLMKEFWAGPLTIILKKAQAIPKTVTAGLETVAVRIPLDDNARKLIELAGVPVAAPSANLSGKPSPTCAKHVIDDLDGRVDFIIAGDKANVGIESTVIDLTRIPPVIVRPGFVTKEQIQEIIGEVEEVDIQAVVESPISPGLKYRHYSPNADLTLFIGDEQRIINRIINRANQLMDENKNVGIICCDEHRDKYINELDERVFINSLGSNLKPEIMAENLFSCLREFDKCDTDIILSESFSDEGVGKALMNRLVKASGGSSVQC